MQETFWGTQISTLPTDQLQPSPSTATRHLQDIQEDNDVEMGEGISEGISGTNLELDSRKELLLLQLKSRPSLRVETKGQGKIGGGIKVLTHRSSWSRKTVNGIQQAQSLQHAESTEGMEGGKTSSSLQGVASTADRASQFASVELAAKDRSGMGASVSHGRKSALIREQASTLDSATVPGIQLQHNPALLSAAHPIGRMHTVSDVETAITLFEECIDMLANLRVSPTFDLCSCQFLFCTRPVLKTIPKGSPR